MTYLRRLVHRTALRQKRRSVARDQFRRGLLAERLEERSLLAGDLGFHSDFWNVMRPTDVNADTFVAPDDALTVINSLNSEGARALPQSMGSEGESSGQSRMYLDVDNDGFLSPADALMVINELNGEGETPLVHYAIAAIDAAGNPLTSIRAGQDFFIQMNLTDLRDFSDTEARGVFAAYTDLLYDSNLATIAVAEVQNLALPNNTTGSFTLSLDGTTQSPAINFNTTTAALRAANTALIQTALDTLLGAGTTTVTQQGTGANYRVAFTGAKVLNVDEPLFTASLGTVTVTEIIKGSSTTLDPTGLPVPSWSAAIQFAPLYQNGKSGANATSPDRIDELGSFYSGPNFPGPGTDPIEVLRIRFLAKLPAGQNSANATFTPDFTNIVRPAGNTHLLGLNPAIPVMQITTAAGLLQITSGPINAQNDTGGPIDEDNTTGVVVDVLSTDTKNPGAPAGNLEIRSFSQSNGGTVSQVTGGLRFVPAANFNGTATFTYVVGIAGNTNPDDTATATVTVTVNPVNDAPVVNIPAAQNGSEDAALTINGISITDVDADAAGSNPGVGVTLSSTTGTITLASTTGLTFTAGDGTADATMTFGGLTTAVNAALAGLSFTGNQNLSGAASLIVTVNDGGNTGSGGPLQDTETVAINLAAVNDAPVNNLNGQPISSPASDQLTTPGVPLAFNAANGNLVTISDVDAGSGSLNVTLSIGAGQGTIRVAGGTEQTTIPLTGTLTTINTALAGLVYTPAAGFASTATLTIVSNDNGNTGSGGAQQTTSDVTIRLDPGFRPFAVIDRLSIDEGTTAVQTIDALNNDFKEVGATTTITAVTQPPAGQGSVAIVNDMLEYTPPGGDFFTPTSPITFTYTIADDVPGSNPSTGTVSITINNVPDAPVANNDGGTAPNFTYGTAVGEPLTKNAAQGLLANDTLVDNNFGAQVATVTVVNPGVRATTGGGSVSIAADGSFTYTPRTTPTQFLGDDTFTYQAVSSLGPTSNTATVTIHVAAPPAVTNSNATAQEDTDLNISIEANYTDPTENRPLGTVEIVSNVPAAAGVVTVGGDGKSFVYDPADNFNTTRPPVSPITFTYRARSVDGRASNVGTVTVTVNEVNDNPTASNVTFLGVKQQAGGVGVDQLVVVPLTGTAPDVNEVLKVTVVNGATADGSGNTAAVATAKGGSVKLENFQIRYTSPTTVTPPGDPDTFTYRLADFDATGGAARNGLSAPATVSVDVVDFVPKTISGKVYLDKNGDGVQQAASGENSLAGVEVRLTGVDFLNNNVNLVVYTDANGNYVFPQKPGQPGVPDDNPNNFLKPPKEGTTYSVTQIQPRFLSSGSDMNTANSGLVTNTNPADNLFSLYWLVTDTSGNISGLTFTERGVDTTNSSGDPNGQLLNANGFITELLWTSSQDGFIMALTVGTKAPTWTMSLGTKWAGATKAEAVLDPSLTMLTLYVSDANGEKAPIVLHQDPSLYTGAMAGSLARFRILGTAVNGQYIIRVDATPQQIPGMTLAAAPGGNGEGEGESSASRDYSRAADAVFTEKSWA